MFLGPGDPDGVCSSVLVSELAELVLAVLLLAAPRPASRPVRSSVPSPSCEHLGFGTPGPH
ncbi:hypothetical protein DMH25_29340 [Streptomyces sp. WAC 01325]|nr:hypothetical protein DMH25_29340 [Streptomyces sp. WAC 01325]